MSDNQWESDTEFEDTKIAGVNAEAKGWSIQRDDGWSFYVPPESPVTPTVGMTARFFGKGIGCTVRGLALDGIVVFYRTRAEQKQKDFDDSIRREQEQRYDFEKNRADLDKRYRSLPEVFQRRIDKFRNNNPDFRWRFEGYEMFCCEQAVVIAESLKTGDAIRTWAKLPFKSQKTLVPKLSEDHSGNTFGCATSLAVHFVCAPENVVKMYGAMAPVVGSLEYGCVPANGE